jgi:hypothetical protein
VADSFLRLLASWALLHEAADDAWKAAVARGSAAARDRVSDSAAMAGSAGGVVPETGRHSEFMDTLAALVSEEKERLKAEIEQPQAARAGSEPQEDLAELRFEMAQIRGRLESMETSLDALLRRCVGDQPEPGSSRPGR